MINTGEISKENEKRHPLISIRSDSSLSEVTDMKLSVDPEEAKFQGAGKSDHMIVNYTNTRMALKAKCTNNSSYRVDPVLQIIEPNKCKNLTITRLPTAPRGKGDKVLIVYTECDDKVTDIKSVFKTAEVKSKLPFLRINLLVANPNDLESGQEKKN